ncbi:DNA repair protein RecN [Candidatus Poribacteria bacterium]|nr:MAG: DNA repair protein RecN [Candidatus Poribacteria bacterium]
MIEELYISNVALIDELQLECDAGLNVFTGETGAGKSVILNAVGLALGERSNAGLVRDGATNAKIQIAVALPPDHPVWAGFNDSEFADALDAEETLVLSRQINASGRSRCHANGQLVSLTFLSAIGDLLVDIHGQHAHQSLFRSETHLDLVDTFGRHEALKAEVCKKYDELHAAQAQLADYSQTLREATQEKDLLEFQLEELEDAQLQEGEEEALSNERHLLSNAETLFESANQLYQELYGSDLSESSTLDGLKISSRTLSKLCELDGSLSELNTRFESALYELEDIVYQIRDYRDKIEFNPHRLSEVEERLDLIHRLKRKYGDSVSEILAYQAQASQKLEDLQFGSERIEELKDQIHLVTQGAQELATELSKKRRETATQLEGLIERELQTLGMEKAVFQILVSPIESAEGPLEIEGKRYELRSDGMDEIEFFISPNVGSEPKPLARIASGGEISRVMLALKTVLAQVDLIPTMIFDEIDAGIGGRTADIVGQKLKELSRFRQVFCITHLPQIARFADQHFRVEKSVEGDRTTISAKLLTPEERVEEVARMHGGEATVTTLAHARELLKGQ